MEEWKLVGLLGPWHNVGANRKAFRFYTRRNRYDRKAYFADYRCEDLVSRHHRLGWMDETAIEIAWAHANTTALELTRDKLADL
jgi:hypothetical protein